MEHLNPPKVQVERHHQQFRVPLLNTRKSSIMGLMLLVLPFLFLSGVVFNHYLKIEFGILTGVYLWIGEMDRAYGDHSWINWLIRFLLVIGPLLAILINLMAITHIRYENQTKELVCSLKLRWQNLGIIGVCSLIFLIFVSYLIIDNLGING